MMTFYIALCLISAATLAFQVALTRFFSLAQGHHFAFMAISLALLGIGASGSYLSLRQPTATTWRRTFSAGALLFTATIPLAYLTINYLPFDSYRIAWESVQLVWLGLYYVALTIPFFFSGLVIGTALAVQPVRAGPIYAANLFGAGLGPLLALFVMALVGGPGTVFFCALLGWLAVISSRMGRVKARNAEPAASTGRRAYLLETTLYSAVAIALIYLVINPPSIFEVRLTPYKSLTQARLYPGSEVVFSEWNAFSRVDVLASQGVRSAPGLSFTYPDELPPQLGLTIDGDNLSPITKPTRPTFTRYLPLFLSFELRPAANVLILEPGGGLSVLTALEGGARSVTVVQRNHTVVKAVAEHFADFNHNLYADPRVSIVIDEPRSFLGRTDQQYDLIILPLTDSFRPVTAGAYTLSEDYRYTVEAISEAFAHLSPQGLLVIERWLQLPPSESLRLWGTMAVGLHHQNETKSPASDRTGAATASNPDAHLMALRSLQTALMIAAKSPLSATDLATTRDFAADRQFDLIWLPDIQQSEANRFGIVPEAAYHRAFADLLASPDTAGFFAEYPYAIAPPTDDYPFFFHFFKWRQTPEILRSLGKSWQPFGGSGYLVLVVLLILVMILSVFFILLPLLWLKDKDRTGSSEPVASTSIAPGKLTKTYLLYFTLLGLGFLFVEIPLLQRFILYLGQPAYAFAIVLSVILISAGLGSRFLSNRLPLKIALLLITLLTFAYPLLLPYLFEATLKLPFTERIMLTAVFLFPLGLLLGVPFPRGLVLVGQTAPELAPWVWAVNGCASVVSAVLAAMIALTWGFSAVLWSAALAYGLAGLVIREAVPRS
jgi:hypothetical protein